MVITITNADKSLIKIIETLNEKLSQPYEIISNSEIPNDETLQAIKMCGKGYSKTYKKFSDFVEELKQEIKNEA